MIIRLLKQSEINILDYYTYQDIIKILVEEIMDGGSNVISNKKKERRNLLQNSRKLG